MKEINDHWFEFSLEEVIDSWSDPDLMNELLLEYTGVKLSDCSFIQKSRWLEATLPNSTKYYWDDTSGDWLSEEHCKDYIDDWDDI